MLELGFSNLTVSRTSDFGLYLCNSDGDEVLLPRRYVPEGFEIGQKIDVFVCHDSEDRLIATTEVPKATVGEFANLKVISMTTVGAFLDWGLSKDLFLPYGEQTREIRVGQFIPVFLYIDKSGRISSTMKVDKHVETYEQSTHLYTQGQQVELFLIGKTDLGFKAVVNGLHAGIIYSSEVFKSIVVGDRIDGFIKQIRPDGKLDLILQNPNLVGHHAADEVAQKIILLLNEQNGYLAVDSKTSADKIYDMFGVSKKRFKIALGGLYRQRLITIDDDGIRLIKAPHAL
jgi:predicted RNA-binding protein (virulence factor B family)